mgnify:CR=1 FL=1
MTSTYSKSSLESFHSFKVRTNERLIDRLHVRLSCRELHVVRESLKDTRECHILARRHGIRFN